MLPPTHILWGTARVTSSPALLGFDILVFKMIG